MNTVYFPSFAAAEVVEVEFLRLQGGTRLLQLLVDTGFSGPSSMILDFKDADLIQAALPPTQTTGALQGLQVRAWVTCQIPALSFQSTTIAILTNLGVLSLPDGINGMVGLSFLRQFARWGAETSAEGWRFILGDQKE